MQNALASFILWFKKEQSASRKSKQKAKMFILKMNLFHFDDYTEITHFGTSIAVTEIFSMLTAVSYCMTMICFRFKFEYSLSRRAIRKEVI